MLFGKEYQNDQEVIISEATLEGLGFLTVSGDLKFTIRANGGATALATSAANTLPALVADNLEGKTL